MDSAMLKMLMGFDCLSWKWEELVHSAFKLRTKILQARRLIKIPNVFIVC